MSASDLIISVDAMGGDYAPESIIEGISIFMKQKNNFYFLIHGDQKKLIPLLKSKSLSESVYQIRHTEKVISMDDKPSLALRRSRNSSMWNAIYSVKTGEANLIVSAGNTGALMALSKMQLKMKKGVQRPAIAASWPTPDGYCVVLDVGANNTNNAHQLVEFAIMGEAFYRALYKKQNPSIGLLNIGSEDLKGHETINEADRLIKTANLKLNYEGYVEGNDISLGRVDVVVTDGFTGNIALKTAEGTAKLIGGFVRKSLQRNLLTRLGALIASNGMHYLKQRMDPRSVNGGVFLGLNGIVVKSHGNTDGLGFANALSVASNMISTSFRKEIRANLDRLEYADQKAELTALKD